MAVTIESDKMISSSEASRDFARLLDKAEHGPYFIMRHNKPEAVMLGIKEYEALKARIAQLEEILDHVFLYAELKAREGEASDEITLEELTSKHKL